MNLSGCRLLPLQTTKIIAAADGPIGWLVFNNPVRHNAMSLEMWQGLGDAARMFEEDPDIRVVVMLGEGGKAFASGADISEFETTRSNAQQKKTYSEISARGHEGLEEMSKPLIAMITGYCIGGGLAIALHADIRFATANSRFGVPAAKLGLGYDYDGISRLARVVGPSSAKDIFFSARQLPAEEALRIGLINFVLDETGIEQAVRDYAGRIARNAPLTIHAVKQAVNVYEKYSELAEAAKIEALVDRCFDSEDYREGRRAFLEKRTPVFKGR